MTGKSGWQRRNCAVDLTFELWYCHSVGFVEFLFGILHDVSDSVSDFHSARRWSKLYRLVIFRDYEESRCFRLV